MATIGSLMIEVGATLARPFLFPAAEQVRPKVAGRVSAELQKVVR